MKYEVVGVERKIGDFKPQDKPGTAYHYDNINLHCLKKNAKVHGYEVQTVKIKSEEGVELIADVGGEVKNLVGHVFDFEFTRFGKVSAYERVK